MKVYFITAKVFENYNLRGINNVQASSYWTIQAIAWKKIQMKLLLEKKTY